MEERADTDATECTATTVKDTPSSLTTSAAVECDIMDQEELAVRWQRMETSELEKQQAQKQVLDLKDQLHACQCRIKLLKNENEALASLFQTLKLQHDTVVVRAGDLSMQLAESRAANDELKDELLVLKTTSKQCSGSKDPLHATSQEACSTRRASDPGCVTDTETTKLSGDALFHPRSSQRFPFDGGSKGRIDTDLRLETTNSMEASEDSIASLDLLGSGRRDFETRDDDQSSNSPSFIERV